MLKKPPSLTYKRSGDVSNEIKMANNIAEQFEDLYSKWSLLDKVGKDARLA